MKITNERIPYNKNNNNNKNNSLINKSISVYSSFLPLDREIDNT